MDIDLQANLPQMSVGPDSDAPFNIGGRISAMRNERGWTLQQASRQCGVSFSTLSKIERDDLSPTITTLSKIAKGMEVSLSQLLEVPQTAPASARRSITRKVEGTLTATSTCDNTLLCGELARRKMVTLRTRVRARDISAYAEWAAYNAEIFLTVLKGTLVVHSQVYLPTRLDEGDSIYYDASSGHLWVSEGEQDAVVLWVYTEK